MEALVQASPKAQQIKPYRAASREDEQVSDKHAKTHPRLNLTILEERDFKAMKLSHTSMVSSIHDLAPRFPFVTGTRGVVMTAGGKYFGMTITSIRMLRRTGSKLPVEVFLDSWDDYDVRICETILPSLNARCYVLADLWKTTPQLGELLKYQYKVFALMFSSFEEVIFLDADAFPAHNPDVLLDSQPYKSTGLVTWPDFWVSTTSHLFYDVAGIPVPPLEARRASESGILLYSKRIHAASLLLATYYNYYGPNFYYPLFSQGAQGEGDKESFLHAAMALEEPFYDVKTPVSVMGSFINGTWNSAGMKQGDPLEDYTLQNAQMTKSGASESEDSVVETFARPLFIHNNIVKLDVKHIFDDPGRWRNETGHLIRLWGEKEERIHDFGFDVERVLWEELAIAACDLGDDECGKIKEYIKEVFAGEVDLEDLFKGSM